MKAAHVYSSIRGRLSVSRSPDRSCRRVVVNLRGGRRGRSRTAPTLRRGLIRVPGPSPAFEISGSHHCPRDSGPPGRAMRRHCKKPCVVGATVRETALRVRRRGSRRQRGVPAPKVGRRFPAPQRAGLSAHLGPLLPPRTSAIRGERTGGTWRSVPGRARGL